MEMKKHKLGDIGEVRMCKRILKEETNTVSGIPFFKIGTFGDVADVFISRKKFEEYKAKYSYPKKGDVLISAAGTIGRTVVFMGEEAYFQDSNIVWIENDETKVVNALLYYAYKNVKWKVSNGSTILRLYNDDLRRTEIIVPADISVQKKIASVLSTLDKRIENLRAQNRVLEQTAKTIYDYTFLQCAGRKTVYNKILKRNIPEGWEVDNLYRIADFTNGLACQKFRPTSEKEKLPVIKIREMHEGITADTEFVKSNIPEKVIVNPGELLFSWSASLEVMIWNGAKGGLNQHIFKVTPKEYFSLYYVYFQLKDYILNFKRMADARKTTMGHITTDHLNQSRIAIPDEESMKEFSMHVTPLFKKQLVNSQQIETLTTQRNTLLPLLMNGHVAVD